jgi:hypothetical protein
MTQDDILYLLGVCRSFRQESARIRGNAKTVHAFARCAVKERPELRRPSCAVQCGSSC